MPKKPKIKSYEEYMKVAVEKAYGDTKKMSKEDWDNSVKERYDRGTNIYNYRIRDFANQSLMGLTGNATDTFNLLNRLDDIIEHEQDPKRKTLAMAVRHVAAPKMEEIIASSMFASVDTFYSEIDDEYDMPMDVKRDIADHRIRANRVISGHHIPGIPLDTNNAELDDLPSSERTFVLTTLIHTFMDNTAGKDPLGNTLPENAAMQELIHEVNVVAGEMADKAVGIKSANFEPQTDREKKDFEDLRNMGKGMSAGQSLSYTGDVKDADSLAAFTAMGAAPNRTELNLTLEKNPIADITAEDFVRKQKAGTLSYSEIEWGESNIDHMLEGLYTIDELKALKRAGLDPAMGITVDGQSLDWHVDGGTSYSRLSMLNNAKKKCEVVSNALNGGTLDVCKFIPDGKGGYTLGNPVPVKTDLSMKSERRSFWTWLKQLFGIEVSIKNKVKEANMTPREYQTEQDRASFLENAERKANSISMREVFSNDSDKIEKTEQVFAKALNIPIEGNANYHEDVNKAIAEAFTYTKFDGKSATLFDTLGRDSSRAHILYLYGMTKGYSFDEMCFGGNNVDRAAIAKEFVEEFRVMKYDKFAESKGLEQNDETRKLYNDYVSEKMEKVEKFCAKSYDVLRKLEVPQVIDPKDPAEFARNYLRMSTLGSLACDFSQAFGTLGRNTLNPSDPTAQAASERQAAMFDFVYYKVLPMQRVTGAATNYANFIASHDYSDLSDDPERTAMDTAARTKAYLNMAGKEVKGIRTWGEVFDNAELCNKLNGFGLAAGMAMGDISAEATDAHINYLFSKEPVEPTVKFDIEGKAIIDCGQTEDISLTVDTVTNSIDNSKKGMQPYFDMAKDVDPKLGFAEVHSKAIDKMNSAKESEKEIVSEEISFDELLSEKEQPVNKAPEKKEPEQSLDLGGMSK